MDNTIGNIVFGLVKISVVLFYKSIFTIRNSFKICANIAVVVISLWMIVNFSVSLFRLHHSSPPSTDKNRLASLSTDALTQLLRDRIKNSLSQQLESTLAPTQSLILSSTS